MGCVSSSLNNVEDGGDKRPLTAMSEREEEDPFFPKEDASPFFTPLSAINDENKNETIEGKEPLFDTDFKFSSDPGQSPFSATSTPATSSSASSDAPFGAGGSTDGAATKGFAATQSSNDMFDIGGGTSFGGGNDFGSASAFGAPPETAPGSRSMNNPAEEESSEEESGDESYSEGSSSSEE